MRSTPSRKPPRRKSGATPAVAAGVAATQVRQLVHSLPESVFRDRRVRGADDRTRDRGPVAPANPPPDVPPWVVAAHGFSGAIADGPTRPRREPRLVIRSAVPRATAAGWSIVDLPADAGVASRIAERDRHAHRRHQQRLAGSAPAAPAGGAPFQKTAGVHGCDARGGRASQSRRRSFWSADRAAHPAHRRSPIRPARLEHQPRPAALSHRAGRAVR